jgi:hypothetical protein
MYITTINKDVIKKTLLLAILLAVVVLLVLIDNTELKVINKGSTM